ncbi:required for meiotic nuclear division protein 1 homolog [Tribolium madens]|uniref:required for meiotic nuclear division protein 1 homolog n=1 Tax=Tribolium madens TaxID=41895 RepID=UPI001CF744F2|nr:required for meiotic nuclear division protein 1 homolog [Tribolium madens]
MTNFIARLSFSILKPQIWASQITRVMPESYLSRVTSYCTTRVTLYPNLTLRPFSSNSRCIQDNISTLQLKKRPIRKKKILEDELVRPPGLYSVVAYATAEEYDLERLIQGLKQLDLYEPKVIANASDVVHAVAKYQVDQEPREIFFFREGSVVLWNVTELESSNVLSFLREFELESHSESLVQEECEIMTYRHQKEGLPSALAKDGDLLVATVDNSEIDLDKYTFSNAMILSVKLAIWEASLERYIGTIEFVTEDLKNGNKIRMSREEVLRKHGELFALRHMINLSSDLLDTPDFYWENEQLENLYLQVCNYFAIAKRTRVMNEKINHCVELIELLSTHLSDKHHVRLEWMIIVLIMVEVAFETIHYIDRYMN